MALEPITREEKYLARAAGQSVEVPEPITRKEMFLNAVAKSGGGSGGGGADLLNENGIIKKEYLPEGFPYKSGEDVVIMPSTTLVRDPDSYFFVIPNTINTSELSEGAKCVVRFEVAGEAFEYEVTAKEVPENDEGLKWLLGNMILLDDEAEDTGEPFLIAILTPEAAAETGTGGMMAYGFPAESLTVSISGFKGTFATIDPGYLPTVETVIVKVVGEFKNINNNTPSVSHTGAEIDALLRKGKVVILEHMPSQDGGTIDYYYLEKWGVYSTVSFCNIRVSAGSVRFRSISTNVSGDLWYTLEYNINNLPSGSV